MINLLTSTRLTTVTGSLVGDTVVGVNLIDYAASSNFLLRATDLYAEDVLHLLLYTDTIVPTGNGD